MSPDHWMRPIQGAAVVCDQRHRVRLLLQFDPASPMFARIVTGRDASGHETSWKLRRDLMSEALDATEPVASGGVLMWSIPARNGAAVVFERGGPGGPVQLYLPAGAVADFLAATYRAVPRTAEPRGGVRS